MADKSVGELIAAQSVTPTDLFVLEQNGTAKKLTGQVLENWLVSFADGHGGIQSIAKLSTSGLVDTYRITLADTTTFDFAVTNGRSITGISKTSTSGLVDTYTIIYNDGTTSKFTVTNGAKGDKGDNAYIWIKYSSQKPTESSHSMGDLPDDWIGIYSGNASTAPTDWQQYTWYQIKGEKGDTGAAATVTGTTVEYMISDSGTIVPSGSWSTTIPTVPQGKYLWTRVTTTFNTGSPAVSYSVTRMGIDGSGSVSSVNDKSPSDSGNVTLTAGDIQTSGGVSVEAKLDTLGEEKQPLLTPGDNISISGSVITTKAFPCNPNLLDNWYFGNPVNQKGQTSWSGLSDYGMSIDRWNYSPSTVASLTSNGVTITADWQQFVENTRLLVGQQFTMSVLTSDGRLGQTTFIFAEGIDINVGVGMGYLVIYNGQGDTRTICRLYGDGSTYLAVKLELGSQQTLAHQENGVWVLNEIPKFGDQLAECQRYFVDITPTQKFNASYIGELSSYGAIITIPLPTSMRTYPTFIGNASDIQIAVESATGYYTPTSVSVIGRSSVFAAIRCDFVHDKSNGTLCDFRRASDGAKFFLSAEL